MGFPRCNNGARSSLTKQNLSRVFDRALQAVTSCIGSMGVNQWSLTIGQRPEGEWWRQFSGLRRRMSELAAASVNVASILFHAFIAYFNLLLIV